MLALGISGGLSPNNVQSPAFRFCTNKGAYFETTNSCRIVWIDEVKHLALSACGEHLNLRRFVLVQNVTAILGGAKTIPKFPPETLRATGFTSPRKSRDVADRF